MRKGAARLPVNLAIPCFLVIVAAMALGIAAGAIAGRVAPESIRGIVAAITGFAVAVGFVAAVVFLSLQR